MQEVEPTAQRATRSKQRALSPYRWASSEGVST